MTLAGADRHTSLACVHVEVETAEGITGHGFTAITEEDVIAQIVNGVAGPAIVGDDALAHEAIWEKLYWKTMPRGQTGYAAHAVAAIDLALWDIKGKALGQPVWRLIGGARNRVPVYATFGFGFFDREQLARRREALGRARLQPAEDDGRQRGAAPARPARRCTMSSRRMRRASPRCATRSGRRSSCSSTPTAISTSITRRSSPR